MYEDSLTKHKENVLSLVPVSITLQQLHLDRLIEQFYITFYYMAGSASGQDDSNPAL